MCSQHAEDQPRTQGNTGWRLRCCLNSIFVQTYLIAKHAIKEGEEVFDCYGPHHLSNAKADRQKLITNAFVFECKCPVGVTCHVSLVTCHVS